MQINARYVYTTYVFSKEPKTSVLFGFHIFLNFFRDGQVGHSFYMFVLQNDIDNSSHFSILV